MKNRRFLTIDDGTPGFSPIFPVSRIHLAQQGRQSLACKPQIRQRKQGQNLPGILRQSVITNLHETKLARHHPEPSQISVPTPESAAPDLQGRVASSSLQDHPSEKIPPWEQT